MSDRSKPWCLAYVSKGTSNEDAFHIQMQCPSVTCNFGARSLQFASQIVAFVAETRGNPAYRDIPRGNGVYEYMPEKAIELSSFLTGIDAKFQKLGEADDSYLLTVECGPGTWIKLHFQGEMMDAFLESMAQIAGELP